MITQVLSKLIRQKTLTTQEAESTMEAIMSGEAGEIRTAAILSTLAAKKETGSEIAAFARIMRKSAKPWPQTGKSNEGDGKILCDTCGTGGDGSHTLNISTLAAILLASLGIPVAKHGNRAVSSKSGSADILEALGVRLDLSSEQSQQCLKEVGICFLFAPHWHPAMKHAAPIRKALGIRTVFNLLGPITNPAPISHQILGVSQEAFQKPIASALAELNREAFVVHAADGLDEISWATTTRFIRVGEGDIQEEGTLSPADFGFSIHPLESLQITDGQTSKETLERSYKLLEGKASEAENQAVAMNAALLYSLVKGVGCKESAQICLEAIQNAKGLELLEQWRSFKG